MSYDFMYHIRCYVSKSKESEYPNEDNFWSRNYNAREDLQELHSLALSLLRAGVFEITRTIIRISLHLHQQHRLFARLSLCIQ